MRKFIQEFIQLEASGGIVLFAFAVLGLILANSPLKTFYDHLLYQGKLYAIINDGLMVLFFLVVGLEIKREILTGELNSFQKILLPAIAAFFGMLVPAVIYVAFTWHDPSLLKGWAIPCATDIAFALGVLSLLGKRIPLSLKIFLTALAIFDDIGAIIIIAIFYTHNIHTFYLLSAAGIFSILCLLNYFGVKKLFFYLLFGVALWYCILQSGVHPTIAGVLLAFTLPSDTKLEHYLHPWTAFFILPLFALANTGIPLSSLEIISPLTLGIVAGLFIGKQLGIFSAIWLSVKSGLTPLPSHSNYKMIYGITLLCGVGFTMSLFIGGLAFTDAETLNTVRAGVLVGSIISGVAGYLVLRRT